MEAEAAMMPEAAVMAEAVQPGVAEAVMTMADGGDPAAAPEAVAAARRRERVGREGAEGEASGGESEEGRKASHVRHSMIRLLADTVAQAPVRVTFAVTFAVPAAPSTKVPRPRWNDLSLTTN
jgi:hypothetical protein